MPWPPSRQGGKRLVGVGLIGIPSPLKKGCGVLPRELRGAARCAKAFFSVIVELRQGGAKTLAELAAGLNARVVGLRGRSRDVARLHNLPVALPEREGCIRCQWWQSQRPRAS